MGLFDKKYDVDKDRLMRQFSPDEGYHYVKVVDGKKVKIDSSELNSKTNRLLKEENQKLASDRELLEKEAKRFYLAERQRKLEKLGYPCHSFEYLGEVQGSISPLMQDFLDDLVSEKDVLLGVHRVKEGVSMADIGDILENGLIIYGHLAGATNSKRDLASTVSYYPDNRTVLKELMYANEYKNASGSILIRIPDEDLEKDNDIYITTGNNVRVNPKYILGFVPVDKDHYVDKLVTKTDLRTEIIKNKK